MSEPQPIPDTYVPVSAMGANFIAAMQPWITEHLAWYLDAAGSMFDPVASIVYDVGTDGNANYVPGYGSLLNPQLCPPSDLGYLGQFVGVQIPVGQDAATALSLVVAESGLSRGTLAALRSAVARSITNPWLPNTAYTTSSPLVSNGNPAVYYVVASNYSSGATFGATDLSHLTVVNPASYYTLLERIGSDGSAQAYWVTIRVSPEMLTPASNTTAITAAINTVIPGGILINLIASDSPTWSAATKTWGAVAGTVTWENVKTGDV